MSDAELSPDGHGSSDLPSGLSQPARRALRHAGLTTLDEVALRTTADLTQLHGIGPKAIRPRSGARDSTTTRRPSTIGWFLDEQHAEDVSYWMVREYVATRRREIRIGAGREPANTFIPQEHLPGREAEVDFGEVAIRLRGELVTCALFSLRLSCSGKAAHRFQCLGRTRSVLRGSRTRVPCPRGRPDREDPLRQPQVRRCKRYRVLPPAGRGQPVGGSECSLSALQR